VVRKVEQFRESGIDLRIGHRVEEIDTGRQVVSGSGPEGQRFKAPYDKLLIATGASPNVPQQPGFDQPGVFVVKTLENARAIKSYLQARPVRRALILGMGYIAMEMTESLVKRGIEVTMAKPEHRLLPWLAPDLAQRVSEELTGQRVRLQYGFTAARIERSAETFRVTGEDGQVLEADVVFVAIGIRPNSELAADAGLALGPARSIAVDRRMCTSDPLIYGAGDCADAYHVVTGAKVWIPLALRANRAGWAVADDLAGKPVSLQGVAGTGIFRLFDLEVARTGLIAEEAEQAGFDPAEVTIASRSRAHGHPGSSDIYVRLLGDKRSGRLLGAQMVGCDGAAHRINAAAVALHAHMTVEQFSQADLSYSPPFGPTWDPLLTAANQLLKAL
jgi:CoA-dependent NAD(P)H sulfur oxidoreductase